MNELEKLRILLPHWVEHNAEHADEFRTWAERLQLAGEAGVAERLLVAAALLDNAHDLLSKLQDEIGGTTPESYTED
jgi:nickel/cobalt exporter